MQLYIVFQAIYNIIHLKKTDSILAKNIQFIRAK